MVTNKKNPASLSFGRRMSKTYFKHCWDMWRAGNDIERLILLSDREWVMCFYVNKNRNTPDPLLVKHVKHVINLEYSQLDMVA